MQISWLLQKPTDLDLHCLQRQGYPGSAGQGLSTVEYKKVKPKSWSDYTALLANLYLHYSQLPPRHLFWCCSSNHKWSYKLTKMTCHLDFWIIIWTASSEKVPSNICKCTDSDQPVPNAKFHLGFCFPFVHSLVSDNSVSWQWKPWSDSGYVQADLGLPCPHKLKIVFCMAWPRFIGTL